MGFDLEERRRGEDETLVNVRISCLDTVSMVWLHGVRWFFTKLKWRFSEGNFDEFM